jgi:DNA invertase Pin-like site-specific DNA recombinase
MRGAIETAQLTRRAFVYVRQSTMAQVLHHHEWTMMQYDLRQRAIALGWAPEAIEVIDKDQARSGTTLDGRTGFARLAGAVAHGEAGAVLALDVSRLARSSEDWRRLLALCGVAGVAVIDEQRIYDPNDQDDKLLLELKGTMSEAELHWLRLRLQGARQHKARRGLLRLAAPTGYVWGERGFELDPNEAVQQAVRVVFHRYEIEPSAWAVVRWARETGLAFPTRQASADRDAGVAWKSLGISRLHHLLTNPVYAGVYPDKTRLLEFGRFAAANRRGRGDGRPASFDFLGFTHSCGKTRRGKFTVLRQTVRTRWQAKLKAVKLELRRRLHESIPAGGAYLRSVVGGHVRYYGVPMNGSSIGAFRSAIGWLWWALKRRSQTHHLSWERMGRYIDRWLPPARICHPYPLVRFGVATQGRSRMR